MLNFGRNLMLPLNYVQRPPHQPLLATLGGNLGTDKLLVCEFNGHESLWTSHAHGSKKPQPVEHDVV
jgi:hypothetical protein